MLYGHEDKDRDRGILSPADREFLRTSGQNLKNEQSRRNARARIRNRIRNGVIDFDLITRLFSKEDRDLIFDEDSEWKPAFVSGQKAMIEFLYDGLADGGNDDIDFDSILKSGVHDAEVNRHDGPVFINVEFNVQSDVQFDISRAKERFENGESLTIADVGALMATGEVEDPDDLQELADLAQEKGVVESSITPMHNHAAEDFDGMDVGDQVALPAGASSDDIVKNTVLRSETLMMMNAYSEAFDFDTDEANEADNIDEAFDAEFEGGAQES